MNAVASGPTFASSYDGGRPLDREAAGTSLGRWVEPEETAGAMLYLARARSITRLMITVDAVQHLGWRKPDIVG